jgi:hypothetical protein
VGGAWRSVVVGGGEIQSTKRFSGRLVTDLGRANKEVLQRCRRRAGNGDRYSQ